MKNTPKISDAEWQVIKILWEQSPMTANEVIEKLETSVDWNHQTIRTLINRLVKKEAVSYNVKGKAYYYYPIVNEEECMKKETRSLLSKVYDGSLNLLIKNFIKDEKFSKKEIDELRSILDNKEKQK
ncbi:BlaI/MecI/CopY family transcriptional regulator [Clostridiaceae bacterium M8S5]|nr:BlaI/MecI/CopY family transcriptional regulator [Clostridiaceae bacterium M8S5]